MEQIPPALPVLPIRNAVLFPGISMPLMVGRAKSLEAIRQSEQNHTLILVVAQKSITSGDPTPEDLYQTGTLCKIENSTLTDQGNRQVVVTGISRYRVAEFSERVGSTGSYLEARGESVADSQGLETIRGTALLGSLKTLAREILEMLPGATEPLIHLIDRLDDPTYLTNVCSAYLNLPLTDKQNLLEQTHVEDRMNLLLLHMQKERDILSLQREIRDKMSERISKAQRDALLREQLRTIRTELGEEDSDDSSEEVEEKLEKAGLPPEAFRQAREEIKKLKLLPSASAEYHVIRTYLDWLASLPWKKSTQDSINLDHARLVLDQEHYGLEPIKKRILQFLAVAKLKKDLKGPILCLVGPPGVGKTSLGQSIAHTLGRKFIRASLGGVRDEAEIRGHRRTYVGAMPGRIIQSIKRAGSRNPVMILDEIDKLHSDFHGDPAAALLEVLDPEQNRTFTDHYLDIPFDLSDVFFIATANISDTIPAPLRDRMEIIDISGYTSHEKLEISQRHLVEREMLAHGLDPGLIKINPDTLERLIEHHTRESGVRELSRKIAALCRATALKIVESSDFTQSLTISRDLVPQLIGPDRFFPEQLLHFSKPGVATGLAWTPHGGDILFIETSRSEGQGKLQLTGQLGDIMKESAQIAVSLTRSMIPRLSREFDFAHEDIHIHVPSGAIPKDGPSAGVALFVALMSLVKSIRVDPMTAMTGEITLRGAVLPVGGIKEKFIAAHRAGLKTILYPRRNEHDLLEIPSPIRNDLKLIAIDSIEDLVAHLFPNSLSVAFPLSA